VEIEECSHCKGIGSIYNGIIYCWCPKCHGTGEITREGGRP
jgi:DnaJ-class molecular chaperone